MAFGDVRLNCLSLWLFWVALSRSSWSPVFFLVSFLLGREFDFPLSVVLEPESEHRADVFSERHMGSFVYLPFW